MNVESVSWTNVWLFAIYILLICLCIITSNGLLNIQKQNDKALSVQKSIDNNLLRLVNHDK